MYRKLQLTSIEKKFNLGITKHDWRCMQIKEYVMKVTPRVTDYHSQKLIRLSKTLLKVEKSYQITACSTRLFLRIFDFACVANIFLLCEKGFGTFQSCN
jgi:hypothetical protein